VGEARGKTNNKDRRLDERNGEYTYGFKKSDERDGDFNKMAFDNLFNAMNILQDQMEKIVSMYPEKAPWFPEEGKKLITDWVKDYKKGRDDFKAIVDDNYKKAEQFFAKNAAK